MQPASTRSAEHRLRQCIQRVQASPDFPAFSQQMRQVMTGLLDADATVQQLANLVLGDYALSAKLLRTANSLHYNRSGRPVRTATHAMMLVGASTVRDLAGGMLLLERYQQNAPGLKEVLLLSMLSAHHAREVALAVGHPEPESAQLTGMFHNLGEVLVARHCPEEYAAVLRLCREEAVSPEQAVRRVLGFRCEDLALAIARIWGMPESVQTAIRARGEAQESRLERITRLSHELTLAVYRAEPEEATALLRAVETRFSARLDIGRAALREIIEAALHETRALFADLGVTLDDLRLVRRTRAALHALGDGSTAAPPPEAPPVATLAQRRTSMVAELDGAGASGAGDLHTLALVALEAALRGAEIDHAALCLLHADREVLRARFGLGPRVERLVSRMVLPAGERSPFAELAAGREVVLGGARTGCAAAERRWLNKLKVRGAAFFPIPVEGSVIGAIGCDQEHSPFPDDAATLEYLRTVGVRLGHAIEAMRRGAGPAATPPGAAPSISTAPVRRAAG